jgi:hypothetical protein
LSTSASVDIVEDGGRLDVTELGLPREGFAALAAKLLPGSRIEVLHADIDMADIEQLLPRLDEWAIDRLRRCRLDFGSRSSGLEVCGPRGVVVSDPATLNVTLTSWGRNQKDQLRFVRSVDLSALGELPVSDTLSGSSFLESVILPARLPAVPSHFFERCPRLSRVGTTGCVSLVRVG